MCRGGPPLKQVAQRLRVGRVEGRAVTAIRAVRPTRGYSRDCRASSMARGKSGPSKAGNASVMENGPGGRPKSAACKSGSIAASSSGARLLGQAGVRPESFERTRARRLVFRLRRIRTLWREAVAASRDRRHAGASKSKWYPAAFPPASMSSFRVIPSIDATPAAAIGCRARNAVRTTRPSLDALRAEADGNPRRGRRGRSRAGHQRRGGRGHRESRAGAAHQRDGPVAEARSSTPPASSFTPIWVARRLRRAAIERIARWPGYTNLEYDLATGRPRRPRQPRRSAALPPDRRRSCRRRQQLRRGDDVGAVGAGARSRGPRLARRAGRNWRWVPGARRHGAVGCAASGGRHDEPHAHRRLRPGHRRPHWRLLRVHPSNFRIEGFTERADARRAGRAWRDDSLCPSSRTLAAVRRAGTTAGEPSAEATVPLPRRRADGSASVAAAWTSSAAAATSCSAARRPA